MTFAFRQGLFGFWPIIFLESFYSNIEDWLSAVLALNNFCSPGLTSAREDLPGGSLGFPNWLEEPPKLAERVQDEKKQGPILHRPWSIQTKAGCQNVPDQQNGFRWTLSKEFQSLKFQYIKVLQNWVLSIAGVSCYKELGFAAETLSKQSGYPTC